MSDACVKCKRAPKQLWNCCPYVLCVACHEGIKQHVPHSA